MFFLVMLKYRSITYYLGFMLLIYSMFSFFVGLKYFLMNKVVFIEWEIFDLLGSLIIMTLLLDWMSLTFMGLVSFISSMVLMYSTYYMFGDKFLNRFIMLVYLFVLSMMLMILSPNMVSILLGWDGLGLVSYCLVIYYQNVKSANAGMLTVLSNRVGDVAILLGIAWMANLGGWNFYYLGLMYNKLFLLLLLIMVIIAGMTKSAQIPFSAWLPAAMAAPTPVSALVHSSTLVTAGVYLLIRFNNILAVSDFVFFIGVLTMFMSGLGANFETDLKKIIALSTLSQLGVMMMVLGMGFWELSFFHLLSHALFKSLLFLCAGVYIHSITDIQDIRLMGGLYKNLPASSLFFMGCSLSLCGIPFLSGFYSKDLILETYELGEMNYFMLMLIFLGTLFTVTYSVRLSYYLFLSNMGVKILNLMEEESGMIYPMSALYIMALVAGSGMSWIYFPVYFIYLPMMYKMMILVGVLVSIFLMYFFIENFVLLKQFMTSVKHFTGGMWFMPFLSVTFFMGGVKQGVKMLKNSDQGWFEFMGSQGIHLYLLNLGLKDTQSLLSLKSFIWCFFLLILVSVMLIF
uniref:NADH dehydrogenase subunit 5 n=1 Tax=Cyphoderus aff. similis TaxID=2901280 RepID=UPI001EDF81F2|nr:NADH dehydrogenase subunit 5 [Cyphoderus aff. similis]UIR97919.1 NADH dehydrogenase subunit 5 [Cyphoderus aff. similis]